MTSELLINVTPRETRVALIENGVLQEILIERASRRGLVGNLYKGKVCRVLPGMQAAFVDVGLGRAAFLHASDVVNGSRAAQGAAAALAAGGAKLGAEAVPPVPAPRVSAPIGELLREGDEILVQVLKDPLGTKGARLTTHVSIPSCYLVYMPGGRSVGVSQRIEDEAERLRLRELVRELMRERAGGGGGGAAPAGDDPPETWLPADGCIVRTAAEGASAQTLAADLDFLERLWTSVRERARTAPAPSLIHEDLPLVIRTLRELGGAEIERIRIDSRETLRRVLEFSEQFLPELVDRIELYAGERPIFDLYGVEDEIRKALDRRVTLKSGGHVVIDQTEAMTTVDVNTGGFVGHRNLEETIFKTNLEAAQAIARQLRLRNLGGIVIIDFIDMESEEHRRLVLRALEKSLDRDPTKTQLSGVSSLGLVQMTRKRTRESLEHVLCESCPTCQGRGTVKTADTVCYEIFREILREARQFDAERLLVIAAEEVIERLVDEESASFAELESFIGRPITLQVESLYPREQYDVVLM